MPEKKNKWHVNNGPHLMGLTPLTGWTAGSERIPRFRLRWAKTQILDRTAEPNRTELKDNIQLYCSNQFFN